MKKQIEEISVNDYAALAGLRADTVRKYCRDKRIPGARQLWGRTWLIPKSALIERKSKAGRPRKEKADAE